MLSQRSEDFAAIAADQEVLVDGSTQRASVSLHQAIALVAGLSPADQRELALHLFQQLSLPAPAAASSSNIPVEATSTVDTDPPGQASAAGWKQAKRVVKERPNGVIDIYIEYWFNCELWSAKEQQWKHRSCYICQHREGKAPSPVAARKLELLHRQIASKRPYHETLSRLNKQQKLEQWQAI
jgi:hypothetical protein